MQDYLQIQDALTYNWEFGDGNTSEGKVVEQLSQQQWTKDMMLN